MHKDKSRSRQWAGFARLHKSICPEIHEADVGLGSDIREINCSVVLRKHGAADVYVLIGDLGQDQYAFGILNLWSGPQGSIALGIGGRLRPFVDHGRLRNSSPR